MVIKNLLFGTGLSSSSQPGAMETPQRLLAVLLGFRRKILFNVSTITIPGVIYSGMLMCLESPGPPLASDTGSAGLWYQAFRSGTAQALRCRCHLFQQQRWMRQESIDDPDSRTARASCLCRNLPLRIHTECITAHA